MRIKFAKSIAILVVLINIFIIYYTWKVFAAYVQESKSSVNPTEASTKAPRRINKLITVVIRDIELNDNDISSTVQSFLNVFPNIQIYVLGDGLPYPPLDFLIQNTTKNVKIVNLTPDLKRPHTSDYPLSEIKTKYVLYVPDSTRISNKQPVQHMLNEIAKSSHKIVASRLSAKSNLQCLNFNIDLRKWTLNFTKTNNNICDIIFGKHVTLIEKDLLKKISNSLLLPFPQSLYLQTASLSYKVCISNNICLRSTAY